MFRCRLLMVYACLVFVTIHPSLTRAESTAESTVEFDFESTIKLIDKLAKKYNENTPESELRDAIQVLLEYSTDANTCAKDTQVKLTEHEQSLAVLGETTKGDSIEVTQQRRLLARQKEVSERKISGCKLVILKANQISEQLKTILQIQMEHELLTLTPPIWRIVRLIFPLKTWSFDQDKFIATSGIKELKEQHGWILGGIILLAFVSFLILQHFLKPKRLKPFFSESNFLDRLFYNLLISFSRFSFPIILFTGWSLLVFWVRYKAPYFSFLSAVCYGGFIYSVLLWINQVLLIPISGAPLVQLSSEDARRISRQFIVLCSGLFLCFLLFAGLLSQSLSAPWLVLVRDFLVTIVAAQLFWLIWLIGHVAVLSSLTRWIRLGFLLALSAILVSEWIGYRNLAEYLLLSVIKTMGALGAFWLVINLLRDFFEGIAEGDHHWQHLVRDMLGLKANEKQPGVYWFYLMILLVLWIGLVLWLLRVWGMPEANFSTLYHYVTEGIHVAEHTIVPIYIGSGILTFFVLFFLFHLIRDRFVKKWLVQTHVERGAREAIVSIIGYIGFILAFLIGLSIAGVNFSNLALIAGALSVGIGFGLQNVVNNFISGIILLFERPVKTGDWVRVGQTEGYVRKISIRTTQIQTFDRADVIVPNSDLIASQVTNRMLRDHYGRVSVKVGVAYGSDVQLVRKLLLEIANKHPSVIKNELVAPEPHVLFLAFGESALLFELRAVIYDIDTQLETVSDFHFAIDENFRKHDIRIPFPQRDIYIRNWAEVKQKLQSNPDDIQP